MSQRGQHARRSKQSQAVSAQYNRPCPTCGAEKLQPCRTKGTGRVTDTHAARLARR